MNLQIALEQVRSECGTLTAKNVVRVARPESHWLHHEFEWDDSIAGPEWRLEQARRLIRRVRCTYVPQGSEESVSVRMFYNIRRPLSDPLRGSYEPITELVGNAQSWQTLEAQMERDFKAFQDRYRRVRGYAALIAQAAAEAA